MGNIVEGNNNPERSGLVKAAPKADVYTANGTWNCPSGHTRMFIEAIGGGGSSPGCGNDGGGSGGGGACARGWFAVEAVGATLAVVVGQTAAGGTGNNGTTGGAGNTGNTSSVQIPSGDYILKAYGGGKGGTNNNNSPGSGGGGGGTGATGTDGASGG